MTALRELARLLGGLDRAGTSVMALARGGRPQEPWALYPDELGIFDRRRHSQFYYHAHAGADHEAGHFHAVRLFRLVISRHCPQCVSCPGRGGHGYADQGRLRGHRGGGRHARGRDGGGRGQAALRLRREARVGRELDQGGRRGRMNVPRRAMVLAIALVVSPAWAAAGGEGGRVGLTLFAVALLVTSAKVGGLLVERWGQPAVLGELLPLGRGPARAVSA